MPDTKLRIPPGESILTPGILLGAFQGSSADGCNALRRVLHDKYLPKLGGKKPLPLVSWTSWFVLENTIDDPPAEKEADATAEAGIEYFCIDAAGLTAISRKASATGPSTAPSSRPVFDPSAITWPRRG